MNPFQTCANMSTVVERSEYLPEFSIQKEILRHCVNNLIRQRKLAAASRIEYTFQWIPESANTVIFFKEPPIPRRLVHTREKPRVGTHQFVTLELDFVRKLALVGSPMSSMWGVLSCVKLGGTSFGIGVAPCIVGRSSGRRPLIVAMRLRVKVC